MELMQRIERVEKWCNDNLQIKPKSKGLLETKELMQYIKSNCIDKSQYKSDINKAVQLISDIKLGNTVKYKECKDNAIAVLLNVLNDKV